MIPVTEIKVAIQSSDILIDEFQKPRTYFKIELHVKAKGEWKTEYL